MTIRAGLHRHTGKRDAEFRRYVDAVRPQFVKFLDGFPEDLAAYCHERGTRIIGRVYIERQQLGAEGGRQVRQVLETARRCPWVDYWELHNEDWQKGADLDRYAELSIEFMQMMETVSRKAVIGCFSTGQPEVAEWGRFLPALRYAAEHGHAWACHEYGGGPPGAKWGVGRNQWNDNHPVTDDPCDDPTVRYLGWWCLRYRRAVDEMRRLGLTTIPDLLITEALIDDIQPRPGGQGKGWRDFKGQHPVNVGDYASQWSWYCQQLSLDPYVIGAVDFGWATADPTWNSFDLSQEPAMFDRLIQEMRAMPDVTPQPAPSDVLAALLRGHLGTRFTDVRASMPRHATLRFGPLSLPALVGIAVHHSAGPREQTPLQIAEYHISKADPFAGVGYHFIIRMGHVYMVGDINTARAHVAGRNHQLLGICTTGDLTVTAPRSEDTTALRDLIAGLDAFLGRALPVDGHGAWALPGHTTACPGALAAIAKSIRTPAGPALDVAALRAAAAAEHAARGITLNAAAALQRTIRADGLTPTTREADFADASGEYVWQRAEGLAGGRATIYVVKKGEWGSVKKITA